MPSGDTIRANHRGGTVKKILLLIVVVALGVVIAQKVRSA